MRYKIAYLTSKNPHDKRVSSGVYYYQSKALEKFCGEVHYLGPVNNYPVKFIRKLIHFLNRFSKRKIIASHNTIISRIYGIIFSRKLKNQQFDFVFADKTSSEIAYLNTKLPVIYSTDATFALLHNYYTGFSNLNRFSAKSGNTIEKRAILNSEMIFCTSEWAASSVKNNYNFSPEKLFVLPRGANIDKIPPAAILEKKRKSETCRLLYMGHDWYRKGYDIAYKTMNYIRTRGIPVKLVAIGCSPPPDLIDNDVEVVNYINKNSEEGRKLFEKLMLDADFYLLPTRAECLGIAFCEASAYGLPVITTDTGGVTQVVKNGINGYALERNSDHTEYGDRIISIYKSDAEYYKLVKSSRKYFDENLSWDLWGKKIKTILDNSLPDLITDKALSSPGELTKHKSA